MITGLKRTGKNRVHVHHLLFIAIKWDPEGSRGVSPTFLFLLMNAILIFFIVTVVG